MDLKKALLEFIEKKPNCSFEDLKKYFDIQFEDEEVSLLKTLRQLEISGDLYLDVYGKYNLMSKKESFIQGKVHFLVSGDAYITTADSKKIFIRKEGSDNLLEKDIVILTNVRNGSKNNLYGDFFKVVKRKSNTVSCEVIIRDGKKILIPYNTNSRSEITVCGNGVQKLGVGELVLVEFDEQIDSNGRIIKTIGHINDPDIDEKSIAYDNGFNTEYSKKYLKELEKYPNEVEFDQDKDPSRVDLRNKMFFTIDGSDTKDIDDAVCIEVLPNGLFKLYVSIADVAHYVKDGTEICDEALKRGTSVYMNDTVIPMFHPKISNGICSLNEKSDRLTKTCEITLSKEGKILDYNVYNSIINSRKKMTYEDVNKIILDGVVPEGYEEYKDDILNMHKLSSLMDKIKEKRGYLSFNSQEIKAKGSGNNIEFIMREQRAAEKIIENFMLTANECVAEYISYCGLPGIYRVHDCPDEDKVKGFLSVLRTMGFKFKNCKGITSNTFIQNVSKTLMNSNCKDSSVFLDLLLVNTMKRARYSNICEGHYGLALKNYTHFTSPIRRYADLQVHKILDMIFALEHQNYDYNEFNKYLGFVADRCTERSTAAEKCEREARLMRMAEYMEHHVGETFNGTVTYVSPKHLSIKTENGITGVLNLSDFYDDYYVFDKETSSIRGRKTGNEYRIGSDIHFIVKSASKINRTVNFCYGVEKKKNKTRRRNRKHKVSDIVNNIENGSKDTPKVLVKKQN